jgi:hypothetical protein
MYELTHRSGKVIQLCVDPGIVRRRQQVMYELPHRNWKHLQL